MFTVFYSHKFDALSWLERFTLWLVLNIPGFESLLRYCLRWLSLLVHPLTCLENSWVRISFEILPTLIVALGSPFDLYWKFLGSNLFRDIAYADCRSWFTLWLVLKIPGFDSLSRYYLRWLSLLVHPLTCIEHSWVRISFEIFPTPIVALGSPFDLYWKFLGSNVFRDTAYADCRS